MVSRKLSDSSIALVAKLLQVAILTGTDVVDNMRVMRFIVDESTGELVPSPDFVASFDRNIEKMLESVNLLVKGDRGDRPH